jgi:hypothetical protein
VLGRCGRASVLTIEHLGNIRPNPNAAGIWQESVNQSIPRYPLFVVHWPPIALLLQSLMDRLEREEQYAKKERELAAALASKRSIQEDNHHLQRELLASTERHQEALTRLNKLKVRPATLLAGGEAILPVAFLTRAGVASTACPQVR